ncbi:hypothetical protein MKX08_002990 [Trichoderma sp. CBMAI-0020]|nr:hypothetical protein MKX08_002990 [Trichoderma sp. CBMAI-0020]
MPSFEKNTFVQDSVQIHCGLFATCKVPEQTDVPSIGSGELRAPISQRAPSHARAGKRDENTASHRYPAPTGDLSECQDATQPHKHGFQYA